MGEAGQLWEQARRASAIVHGCVSGTPALAQRRCATKMCWTHERVRETLCHQNPSFSRGGVDRKGSLCAEKASTSQSPEGDNFG